MKIYNYKHHIAFSILISCIIGGGYFFILKPSQFSTVQGVIESLDFNYSHTQIDYGYDLLFTIVIISLLIILALYKPVKRVADKKLSKSLK